MSLDGISTDAKASQNTSARPACPATFGLGDHTTACGVDSIEVRSVLPIDLPIVPDELQILRLHFGDLIADAFQIIQ
jgi:hypothetical protein